MSFLSVEDISTIQLDHTSRCNLACPQCARTVNPKFKKDLSIDDYKIILEPFDNIKFFHCGNYGDAIASPTFDETYDYYISKVSAVKIATNGSLRNQDWWQGLQQRSSDKLTVVFSVDGLEDTNHLYRIGSDYKKIIDNISAFVKAGGNAEWHYIVFEHNYHQVSQAQQLANDLGCSNFKVKYSTRELMSKVDTKEYNNQPLSVNKNKIDEIVKTYKSFKNYTQQTDILCKAKIERKVFIDYDMNLLPCCWFGAHDPPAWPQMQKVFDKYGKTFYNLREQGWNILQHDFYENYLQDSWNNKQNRIYTCGRTCGRNFQSSSGYGYNIT